MRPGRARKRRDGPGPLAQPLVREALTFLAAWALWAAVPVLAGTPSSQDIHTLLFQANQAYLDNHYQEARDLYETLIRRGHINGHIFFNLGNTYIRLGRVGKAILNYKKACLLLPRDGDLKANLRYARSLARDRIDAGSQGLWSTLAFWYFGMNLWELLLSFAFLNGVLWVSAVLLLYRQSEWMKWTLWLSLVLALLAGASAWMKYRETFQTREGVVLVEETPVRAGFSRADTTLFVLHEGAEFTILDELEGWWKISLRDGNKGWIPDKVAGRVALRPT